MCDYRYSLTIVFIIVHSAKINANLLDEMLPTEFQLNRPKKRSFDPFINNLKILKIE